MAAQFAEPLSNQGGRRRTVLPTIWAMSRRCIARVGRSCADRMTMRRLPADRCPGEFAVTAVLTLSYSSGPVEGTVNRIKMIKRQMFGRANFDLLRIL